MILRRVVHRLIASKRSAPLHRLIHPSITGHEYVFAERQGEDVVYDVCPICRTFWWSLTWLTGVHHDTARRRLTR